LGFKNVAVGRSKGLAAFTGFFYKKNVRAFHQDKKMWHDNKVKVRVPLY